MTTTTEFPGFDAKVRKDRVLTIPEHIWNRFKLSTGDIFQILEWKLLEKEPKTKPSSSITQSENNHTESKS